MTPADAETAVLEPERRSYGGTADRGPPRCRTLRSGALWRPFFLLGRSGADRLGIGAGGLPGAGASLLRRAISQAERSSVELLAGQAGWLASCGERGGNGAEFPCFKLAAGLVVRRTPSFWVICQFDKPNGSARNLGPSSIPSLGDGVMLGTAWIGFASRHAGLHSLLPRPP